MHKRIQILGILFLLFVTILNPIHFDNNKIRAKPQSTIEHLSFFSVNGSINYPLPIDYSKIKAIWMNSYDEMSNGLIKIRDLEKYDPQNTYENYIKNRNSKPFFIQRLTERLNYDGRPLVIVYVSSNLMPNLEDEINIYSSTLADVGYDNIVFETYEGTVEDLKDHILGYWNNGNNLVGVVLIGDLPVAWYSHDEEFLCDLFLMDMDGKWIDSDSDGLYDAHTDGNGDTAPEIFIGRIDASNVPGNEKGEIEIIKKYLFKVHEFWIGNIPQTNIALTYTDHDWSGWDAMENDIGYIYKNYKVISYPNVNRNDYLRNQLSGHYEFIQLTCHSKSFGHLFDDGGLAFSSTIRLASPNALFYSLFCCHALKFTDYNCLGNAYILDTNSPSLAVFGSTKSGLMHDFRYFYEPFGQGYSFGQALQKWFEYKYPYNEHDIASYYGMTILGDPTLKVDKSYRADAHGPYYRLIDTPIYFSGSATGGTPPYTWFWDFGDGNTSTLKNPEHEYSSPGNYKVTFIITDSKNNSTSDITWAYIKKYNNPPNPPTISGPTIGKVRRKYYYDLFSEDVDGDEWIEYYIDWGDGIITNGLGPYKTEKRVTFYHKWTKRGIYYISAMAIDSYGDHSEWSDPIPMSIPRYRTNPNSYLLIFFGKYPILQRLLYLWT